MFRWRRISRAADGTVPETGVAEWVVRDAEQLVRGVWAQELLQRQDHAERAVRLAYEDYFIAYQCLADAHRAGDPKQIVAAHAALEQALEVVRESSAARDRVRRMLRGEPNPMDRTTEQNAALPPVRPGEQDESATPSRLPEAAGAPPRWLGRLVKWRTAGPDGP